MYQMRSLGGSPERRGASVPPMHMNKKVSERNPFHWNFPKNCLCLEQRFSEGRENISSPYFSSTEHQERLKKERAQRVAHSELHDCTHELFQDTLFFRTP